MRRCKRCGEPIELRRAARDGRWLVFDAGTARQHSAWLCKGRQKTRELTEKKT